MILRKPEYYDGFTCLAGACPDSCCHQWAVVVDAEKAALYRSLPGALGDRLRAHLKTEDGEEILGLEPDGRCPMWRQDGLCDLQALLGEEALCDTCRSFPRLCHDYGSFRELDLELSCPEAARLILADGCCWHEQEMHGAGEGDYDPACMDILLRTRAQALAALADRSRTLGDYLSALLLFGYDVEGALEVGGTPVFFTASLDAVRAHLPEQGDLEAVLEYYAGLEILTDRWRARLAQPMGGRWHEGYRALVRYFINRYWLQAVSDLDLVSRIKFIIASCLVICSLGGDFLQTSQLYSKEIENDLENLESLMDAAFDSRAFADANLLALLRDK